MSLLPKWFRRLSHPIRTRQQVTARRPYLEPLEDRFLLTAYTITTTKDLLGDTTTGELTLRDALTAIRTQAVSGNAPAGTASNTVKFAIGAMGSVQTINVTSALPALTHQAFLDGWSQGGMSYSGPPLIILNGAGAGGGANGLTLAAGSDNSLVRGMVILQFDANGIELNGTSQNQIVGDFLGTDTSSTSGLGNGNDGVFIHNGATNNTIGGLSASSTNVISGNGNNGVEISDSNANGNLLLGNRLGTDAGGTVALGNTNGVLIGQGATGNTVGGLSSGAANVISGNVLSGVDIQDSGTSGNVVLGNLIGTDKSGTKALGNGGDGVFIFSGAAGNTLGGTSAAAGNVISANQRNGVEIDFDGTSGNVVQGNLIGTDKTGTKALGNATAGVLLFFDATGNTVGGSAPGAGNVISANGGNAVEFDAAGTSGNVVLGNLIGTDKSGTKRLGNSGDGVFFDSATGNTVGGTATGAANVISANINGMELSGATGNTVLGNRIGTDKSGTLSLGNSGYGILLDQGASQNTIGGTASGTGNTIAFNAKGVVIRDAATTGVSILGNNIWANTGPGIDLDDNGLTANGPNPRPSANHGQNSPVVTAVSANSVSFTLSSSAHTTFRVELFASPGTGPAFQGKVFLGFANVTTNAAGTISFTAPTAVIPSGYVVTATATNLTTGDTSEFSQFSQSVTRTIVASPAISFSTAAQFVSLSIRVVVGNESVPTGMVAVTIAGIPGQVTAKVGSNGQVVVRFLIPAGMPVGQYLIRVSYLGTPMFLASTATSLLTISRPLGRRCGP
jgi:hypothetical protein